MKASTRAGAHESLRSKHTGKQQLLVVCVSDTHDLHNTPQLKVPQGDVLIFAGDAGLEDSHDIERFEAWLQAQPHAHRLVIFGNMDSAAARPTDPAKQLTSSSGKPCISLEHATVLHDSIQEVAGYRVFGSPWTPKFCGEWQFASDDVARQHWQQLLPRDAKIDILITHGPPYGFGDTSRNRHVGDKALLEAVQRLEQPPLLWVCGHIHESVGEHRVPHPQAPQDILLINAAVNNLRKGEAAAAPRTVQLPEGTVHGPDVPGTHRLQHEQQPGSIWKAVVDYVGF